ncbi:Protein-arginine kinase activator protein McsA [Desulfonispora thiosulfatigenes DSM 11270]|uniref:Protein-arginine kinase activator protein McsA n=1 Tax=Desulfonispora thiosulfatigenes DSM 11270 TaxID=656914 RepID=A0A1W1UTU1_DESTI|nr:UvrB/UvrC motif-containing protein [Desulfonispora thiosulfatigenes]SMB84522.1 Protein-arginine kinase activator protein McsA [Desulfonispora thiosulfatigenes DSM 11270]
MYCEDCNEKVANIYLTKTINGKKMEKYICEDCAKKYQEQFGVVFKPQLSFSNLLGSLFENEFIPQIGSISSNGLKCEKCGMDHHKFAKDGRLGCNECFNYFGMQLEPLLKRLHGTTKHTGKIPKRIGGGLRIKNEIKLMREKLQYAVSKEEFEEAAKLRDSIKELESKISKEE